MGCYGKLHNKEFCIYSALYILPLMVLRYFCLLSPHLFAVLHNSMQIGFVDFYEQLLDFRKIGFCREFRFLHVTLEFRFELVHKLEEFGCIRPILTHILAVADSQQFFVLLVPAGDDASLLQNVKCCVIQSHKVHGVLVDMGSILLRFRMLRLFILVDSRCQTSKQGLERVDRIVTQISRNQERMFAFRIDIFTDADFKDIIFTLTCNQSFEASLFELVFERLRRSAIPQ